MGNAAGVIDQANLEKYHAATDEEKREAEEKYPELTALLSAAGTNDKDAPVCKPLTSPSKSGRQQPASWLWKHATWGLYLDDHGNAYYYNSSTGESSWEVPAEFGEMKLPISETYLTVTVPEEVEPGQMFPYEVNGVEIAILCPLGCSPGMKVDLASTNENINLYTSEDYGDSEVAFGYDGYDGTYNAEEYANEYDSHFNTAANAIVYAEGTEEDYVDYSQVWTLLAFNGAFDVTIIEDDIRTAEALLADVAQGLYTPENLLQITWAYRITLFKRAIKALYLEGGDMFDSSKYDNCDGTPEYKNAGFIEWYGDLRLQRDHNDERLVSGDIGYEGAYSTLQKKLEAEYKTLEALALEGDNKQLLEGLFRRREAVSVELDNLRARVLAVVSVEGGPSRESLDEVFTYLKDRFAGNAEAEANALDAALCAGGEVSAEPTTDDADANLMDLSPKLKSAMEHLSPAMTPMNMSPMPTQRMASNQPDKPAAQPTEPDGAASADETDDEEANNSEDEASTSDQEEEEDEEEEDETDEVQAALDAEEMEEFLSNQLEKRHWFVVDIVLDMVLLEAEFDSLTAQIERFQRKVQIEEAEAAAAAAEEGDKPIEDKGTKDVTENRSSSLINDAIGDDDCAPPSIVRRGSTFMSFKAKSAIEEANKPESADEPIDATFSMEKLLQKQQAEVDNAIKELDSQTHAKGTAIKDDFKKQTKEKTASLVAEGMSPEEAKKRATKEISAETEANLKSIKADYEKKLKTVLNAKKNFAYLVSMNEAENKKVEGKLRAQLDQQMIQMKKEVQDKKMARATDLVAEGKAPDEAARIASEEASAEERRLADELEVDLKVKLKERNQASLDALKKQAEDEGKRLEDDLRTKAEKKKSDLQKRLAERKAAKQKELDAVSSDPANIADAQAKVKMEQEIMEIDNEAEEEMSKVEEQTAKKIYDTRDGLLNTIKSAHDKEIKRLESDLIAEKDRKSKDLKARLEKKKMMRAQELLAESPSTSSAIAVALAQAEVAAEQEEEQQKIDTSASKQLEDNRKEMLDSIKDAHEKELEKLENDLAHQGNKVRKNLEARLARKRELKKQEIKLESAIEGKDISSSELEEKVYKEMAPDEDAAKAALEEKLNKLKSSHEQQKDRLQAEMDTRKAGQDKRLQERLAKRKKKSANDSSAGEEMASPRRPSKVDADLSVAAAPVEAAPAEAAPAPAPAPAVPLGTTYEECMVNRKAEHSHLVARLKALIEQQTAVYIKDVESKVSSNNVASRNRLAKEILRFNRINEALVQGFNKKFLYESKALKSFFKSKSSDGKGRLTDEEIDSFKCSKEHLQSLDEASEAILKRNVRDIHGFIDTIEAERVNTMKDMVVKGSSLAALNDTERDLAESSTDGYDAMFEKATVFMAGLWIDSAALSEGEENVPEKEDIDLDEDFDADVVDKRHFGQRLLEWFREVVDLVRNYSESISTLVFTFDEVLQQHINLPPDAMARDCSRKLRYQLTKPVSSILLKSHFMQTRGSAGSIAFAAALKSEGATPPSSTAPGQLKAYVARAFDAETKAGTIKEAFEYKLPQSKSSSNVVSEGKVISVVVEAFRSSLNKFIATPIISKEEREKVTEASIRNKKVSRRKSFASVKTPEDMLKERQNALVKALDSEMDKIHRDWAEKKRKAEEGEKEQPTPSKRGVAASGSKADVSKATVFNELSSEQKETSTQASEAVKHAIMTANAKQLEMLNSEGLRSVLDKYLNGDLSDVKVDDVMDSQREVELARQQQREQKEVQRVMQQHAESADQLAVALKMQKARGKQALQQRLLNRNKKKGAASN